MAPSKLPEELTWPKLLGTSLAAVTAAWLAGHWNVGGTLTGVAIGSIIATFGAAFFTSTIDKTQKTILVRTDRGTVVGTQGESDVVDDGNHTAVLPAQPDEPAQPDLPIDAEAPSRWSRIHWKTVAIAALITMAITLAAISIYEGAVGRTWGSNEPGTSIGNTVRGGPQTPALPTPTPSEEPTEEPSEDPTEEPTEVPTATPTPTGTTTPTPTPTPTPTECPTPTATPADPATPSPGPTDCPTPTPSPTNDSLLNLNP